MSPTPAHAVVRFIQCSRCSLPFRSPLRLPCGNTLCRPCLPPIRPRAGVSYPANEDRKQGFTCLWGREECGADHCLGDCGADVLLSRLVDIFDQVLGKDGYEITWRASSGDDAAGSDVKSASVGSLDLLGGVYGLVKHGLLDYGAVEIRYKPSAYVNVGRHRRTFGELKAAVRGELDCQVCYSLILDPLTTPCGHTFCRGCVAMALNHSDLCPICRRKLNLSTVLQSERVNKRVSGLVEFLFPDEVATRRADLAPDIDADNEGRIPLFISSLAFPTMPIFLHVFEPRYRLMIQRVMESRGRKFGMVMHNSRGRYQQGLGSAPFLQYGTTLVVDRYELLPDGRSLVIATGLSRFKVLSSELVDGYYVGTIQRIEDVSISEEEAQEFMDISAVDSHSLMTNATERLIESMSTQQLFQLALDFVLKKRREGAPWLHPRVLLAYGALPTDPAVFPWWFGTILPVWDQEKYALLSTTTVRQRLKITARWIKRMENRHWYVHFQTRTSLISRSSGIVTSFTPFSMSVWISFGSDEAISSYDTPELPPVATQDSESYITQTLVLGLFLAIFATQMAANFVQAARSRRQARLDSTQPAQTMQEQPDIPTEPQDEAEGRPPSPARSANSDRDIG
ncbi:hypothetical protein P175DRAFT_0510583 [Aspergillus ochraceoroseus IBT 24754]|uniref:RING-type domain-containing protein n=1 Tax=Aspergillus ochraceoroseus IBT 24754 TaxID=1392256 RepID=A0A2T5LSP9_9EURO|nr:uncharacterized protein P175DRAFT_0510583 [Aspergillus ochraceoroseus IBT 24754]PTU19308.1 hypothetical protein P175DRAFT_0510583 [Aspergillus ochraceoroseus IBT 24754]